MISEIKQKNYSLQIHKELTTLSFQSSSNPFSNSQATKRIQYDALSMRSLVQ